MDADTKLQALNAVLRVAARHPSVLHEEAFDELVAVIAEHAAFDRIGIMVPDGPLSLRMYAVWPRLAGPLSFGERTPGEPHVWHTLFEEQRAHFEDDMLRGTEVVRAAARGIVRSFGAFPIRVTEARARSSAPPGAPRVVALLVLSSLTPGAARGLPAALMQDIADAIGPSVERALELAREHRLAMILETSGDAMLAWDREGRITDANGAAAALTGRRRSELIGTPVSALLAPLPTPGDGGAAPAGVRLELLARTPTGPRRVPVAATVTAVSDDAQVAAHALLRDLSLVVLAEQEAAARLARIHELEEQHRTLLDNAPLIIFRLDPVTGELVYLNRHAERLLGVPTAEALGTPGFLRAAHADAHGVAAFDDAVGRARTGALSLPYEARLSRRHGGAITARGTVYPLLAEGGGVVAIEGVLADVSAEHAARTRLVQADRLSTLGTLAAGVAHEINNPAAFILLGLDLLERMLRGRGVEMAPAVAASTTDTVRELRESIRRIVDIARDLRLFASPPGPGGGARSIVDVNRTVESALSLTRGQILERAQAERHLEELPPVLMDGGQLAQVLVNLLANAVQAIPRSYAGEHRITVATRSDGRVVEIEISDTGEGIPEENLQRIWEPFFTTKGVDAGAGLGLSISRDIIERAGGTIVAESPVPGSLPPSGTRFRITLPAAGGEEPADPRSSPPPPSMEARARVLIVEDEAPLLRALADEIGRHHDVVTAPGAEAALAALAAAPFDAVLCDLRMPGMSGETLHARVRERDPDQSDAFVFMTGVGFGADLEKFLATSGRPVLEKPFPAAAALEAIARVIKKKTLY
jgi:PAS domain S-box-containing protein